MSNPRVLPPDNIFGASYGALFHEMFAEAGKRTFLKARAMYVGSQAHPTTFYSDSYDYPNYVLGVVNSGWGGWVWAPETRHATESADFARRAQLMLFSGLASMDGWNTGFVRHRHAFRTPSSRLVLG